MSTVTSPPASDTPAPQPARAGSSARLAWPLALAGAVLLAAGALLSWAYVPGILGNVTIVLYPGSVQNFMIVVAILAVVFLLVGRGPLRRLGPWVDSSRALHALGVTSTAYMLLILVIITVQAHGLVNADPGAFVSLAGAVALLVGSWLLPPTPAKDPLFKVLPGWLELLFVVLVLALALFGSAYALGQEDGTVFCLFCVFIGGVAFALARSGFFAWFGGVAQRHRQVITLGAFAVAFLFPFTQGGSDANMSIATSILIFAATAMGLNIVVGLAGLLDLGYVAFLGAGAYTAAVLSESAFATVGWRPPFYLVVVIGACVSATLGLIIGTPTLRVSGDYLAIVTLAFGEIFRLTMGNLDGNNGPNLTRGPNGIPAIPELQIGGFNFGDSHLLFGVIINRFANYYFLLLFFAVFVILVFVRLNSSRIGRGWVAIREDERAADAMGVNTFGLKLFAFASGAFLAGMAGTIKAHVDVSVTPDQFVFLESAFLLAAIVLGGMGTVAGVLIGATILKLLPEKLRFVSDYRLLLFGLLLVLIMRFRPEGLVPSRRRQLEFHEEDTELAEKIEEEHLEVTAQLEAADETEAPA
ncbi:MAG: branched-chain amino acid ABC transporter permease [Dermatophilaceae bacterium]